MVASQSIVRAVAVCPKSWIDWFLHLAKKPRAIAIVFGAMMLAAVIVVYVPKRTLALFRRRGSARRARVCHA